MTGALKDHQQGILAAWRGCLSSVLALEFIKLHCAIFLSELVLSIHSFSGTGYYNSRMQLKRFFFLILYTLSNTTRGVERRALESGKVPGLGWSIYGKKSLKVYCRNAYGSSGSLLKILSKNTTKPSLLLLTVHAHCVSSFVDFKNLMPGSFGYHIYKLNPYFWSLWEKKFLSNLSLLKKVSHCLIWDGLCFFQLTSKPQHSPANSRKTLVLTI